MAAEAPGEHMFSPEMFKILTVRRNKTSTGTNLSLIKREKGGSNLRKEHFIVFIGSIREGTEATSQLHL